MRIQKGQTVLVMIFVIGIVVLAMLIGTTTFSTNQVKISENSYNSRKAFYAAQGGIEDLLVRLEQNPGLGQTIYTTNNIYLGEAYYIATISALGPGEKIATSTGIFKNFVKTIEVKLASSSAQTSFTSAVQTGNGGFELFGNSLVKCKAPCFEGNVYSNGDIKGVRQSPLTSASRISGSAWAVGNITKLGASDTGVRIDKNASASALLDCEVVEDQWATAAAPSVNCQLSPGKTYTQTATGPPELPLPGFDQPYWQSQAINPSIGGGVWSGDCDVLSGGADDCTNGTGELGPRKIEGNLTMDSNVNLTINGAIWVTGNVNIASNNTIALDPSFTNTGTVLLSDGTINTGSNVAYASTGAAVVMMASSRNDGNNCDDASISVSSNTNNVVFYALNGCVAVASNSQFYGAIVGQKVRVGTNSTVEYDPALASAIFGSTSAGGFGSFSWREVD